MLTAGCAAAHRIGNSRRAVIFDVAAPGAGFVAARLDHLLERLESFLTRRSSAPTALPLFDTRSGLAVGEGIAPCRKIRAIRCPGGVSCLAR
jgi:hypothetical protein